jgi:hypothetical protein
MILTALNINFYQDINGTFHAKRKAFLNDISVLSLPSIIMPTRSFTYSKFYIKITISHNIGIFNISFEKDTASINHLKIISVYSRL